MMAADIRTGAAATPVAPGTIGSAQEVADAARAGDMFVLVGDGRAGSESYLVIPADRADATAINRMAREARGLVCLALDEAIVDALDLPLMPQTNRTRITTAYTMSIEARDGVSTGISAADRALTVAAAIRPGARPDDLASPGHVFPIRVEDGELAYRPSAPAAAVALSRAAGRAPAAVLCAIMTTDGRMADPAETAAFAEAAGLGLSDIRAVAALMDAG